MKSPIETLPAVNAHLRMALSRRTARVAAAAECYTHRKLILQIPANFGNRSAIGRNRLSRSIALRRGFPCPDPAK